MIRARVAIIDCGQGACSCELVNILRQSSDIAFEIERIGPSQDIPIEDCSAFVRQSRADTLAIVLSSATQGDAALLIPAIKKNYPDISVLLVLESTEPEALYDLLNSGVDDFVSPPLKGFEIILRLRRLLDKRATEGPFASEMKAALGLKQLIGQSSVFLNEIHKVPLLAKCDTTVLICGETGTGKELCARAIHYLSPRSGRPFIPVNCGAVPVELIENELFGHERGAFTGATQPNEGLVQEAEGGTLFLDEVDCLPLSAQVKLLRFLQEKEFRPLGSKKMRRADLRLLAATNIDFQQAVETGKLRQDLYYRLTVVSLVLPPLRQRAEDLPLLAKYFLGKFSSEFNKPAMEFSPDAMQLLLSYEWPGNVRQLEHIVERAVIFSEQQLIQPKDLVLPSPKTSVLEPFQDAKAKAVADFEKAYLQRLLVLHHGNISKAARTANKNRRAFWELLRKHQVDAQVFKT